MTLLDSFLKQISSPSWFVFSSKAINSVWRVDLSKNGNNNPSIPVENNIVDCLLVAFISGKKKKTVIRLSNPTATVIVNVFNFCLDKPFYHS